MDAPTSASHGVARRRRACCRAVAMANDVPVLVVGAGPTGLLLAAELRRRGVRCRLIDAHAAPLHWDRATVIHPRSLEVFEALGLVERFLAAGVEQRVARLHSSGAVLGEIDLALCGSRYGFNLGLSEEVTESILTEHLRTHGGDVTRGARLVDLAARGDGVRATIERDGAREELDARWVVGCDGLHSTTRELAGIELAGHDIPDPWAVLDVTLAGWSEPYEANYAYLDDVPVILTALPGRRWRVYLRPTASDSDLVTDAASTLARYHPEVRFEDVASPTRFHCHTRVATRFRAGRVLVAGDAAHVCSPAQGHGMNTGLQDAFNLAWKLALVCRGDASDALLDSYEAERRPVAETVTAEGDAAEHAHTIADPAERRARDAALRATFADPASRHHEAIAEAELDVDYGRSPIVAGDAHPDVGPGARLPDTLALAGARDAVGPVRSPATGARFLHELAHRAGHTALVVGGADATPDALARVARDVGRAADERAALLEATHVVAARDDAPQAWPRLAPRDAERIASAGDAVVLLAVRPDGHVGLRAERDHAAALAAYASRVVRGRAF